MRHSATFGVQAGLESVDMAAVRWRKREMDEGLITMHRDHFTASGAELNMGTGAVRRAQNHRSALERRRRPPADG